VWHVTAKESSVDWVAVRMTGAKSLLIFGAIHNQQACRAALARWLIRQTREHLVPRLQHVSSEVGLRYKRCFVKRQRTRWASCSRHATITLNVKLLFLPQQIVEYVMTHELCHLKEMNHSKRFWQLLESLFPRYRKLDEQLRDMWKIVPRWAV
jgi:predicted metal-dependent hydrolase